MGKLDGKVAFVTGAARGQGRSHAIRLAQEGADIIAVDICQTVPGIPYAGATEADLEQTVKEVDALGRRIVARQADVRDFDQLKAGFDAGLAELGRVDIVSANAGTFAFGHLAHEHSEQEWDATVDTNLKGVWHTVKAAIPTLIEQGNGGSIVITSSMAGLRAAQNLAAYVASKHGVVGLSRALALELAEHSIRVNTVHPTSVHTPMIINDASYRLMRPDVEEPTLEDAEPVFRQLNALPIAWVEPSDISDAVLWLASDDSKYVTGTELKVDAGAAIK